jgi:hypothetical protein
MRFGHQDTLLLVKLPFARHVGRERQIASADRGPVRRPAERADHRVGLVVEAAGRGLAFRAGIQVTGDGLGDALGQLAEQKRPQVPFAQALDLWHTYLLLQPMGLVFLSLLTAQVPAIL